jgi:hypothetical protein
MSSKFGLYGLRFVGFDVEFMLHLLLDIYARLRKKRKREDVKGQLSDAITAGDAADVDLASALQQALSAVAKEVSFPYLQNLDPNVWQKWQVRVQSHTSVHSSLASLCGLSLSLKPACVS